MNSSAKIYYLTLNTLAGQCRADSNNGNGRADYNCAANQYLLSGFAYMQNVINQVLMEVGLYSCY